MILFCPATSSEVTVLYTTIDYGELGLQLSLKENQKRTVSYKEKIRTHGILNGFPVGSCISSAVVLIVFCTWYYSGSSDTLLYSNQ